MFLLIALVVVAMIFGFLPSLVNTVLIALAVAFGLVILYNMLMRFVRRGGG